MIYPAAASSRSLPRPVVEDARRGTVHREEAFHADLLQCHVLRRPQRGDRREETERRALTLEVDRQDRGPGLSWCRALRERGKAGEFEQSCEQLRRLLRAIGDRVRL